MVKGDWRKVLIAAKEHKERKKSRKTRSVYSLLGPSSSLQPRPIHQTRNLRITYAGRSLLRQLKIKPGICIMTDPIKPDPLQDELHAPRTGEPQRDGASALDYLKPDNGPWLPIVVGGSALLIAAGYFLGRYYVQLHAQTPTDRFLHELEDWVDERSEALPKTVRDKLHATVGFLSTSLRNTPINQIVSRFQNKPRRLFDLF
jgi:hypothetical protein